MAAGGDASVVSIPDQFEVKTPPIWDLRPLGKRERSAFLKRPNGGRTDRIKTHTCPICHANIEDVDAATHYAREDHTFEALEAARQFRNRLIGNPDGKLRFK